MQVFSDARALSLKSALLLETLEAAVKLPLPGDMYNGNHRSGGADNGDRDKPPCLPKITRNHQAQARLALTPNAVFVAGCDLKTITTGWKITVKSAPLWCSCFDPVGVEAFKSMAEADQLGRIEAQSRKAKLDTMLARTDAKVICRIRARFFCGLILTNRDGLRTTDPELGQIVYNDFLQHSIRDRCLHGLEAWINNAH